MCQSARQKGIFLQLILLDGWMLKHSNLWLRHAYQRDNNINGVDGDPRNTGTGRDKEQGICSLGNPKCMEFEKTYARKVVDTVNDFDNIYFEIANENPNREWDLAMCDYIKELERSKPIQHLLMPSDLPPHTDISGRWDTASVHAGVLEKRKLRQPVIFDSDGIGYPGTDKARRCVWTAFASGAHVDHLDRTLIYRKPSWQPALSRRVFRKQLGYVARFAKQVKFWEMQPNDAMVKSGTAFVMASASEVIGYLPSGGSIKLDLTGMPGELKARWYDPLDGTIGEAITVDGGVEVQLQAPDGNDWALLIRN
jgi:hypothetical protein